MPPENNDLPLAITKAVEAVEAQQANATPSPVPPAPSPSDQGDTPPSTSGEAGGTHPEDAARPRDSSGRFAPKPIPGAPAPEPSVDGQAPAAPEGGGSPGELPPPASWRAPLKEKWGTIDPEVKAEIARREAEINHGLAASAHRAKAAQVVLQEFEPYAEVLQAEGVTPAAAMRTLLQTAYALRSSGPEHRKAIFLDLAQQYGVDLSSGINSGQAQAEARAFQADIGMRTIQTQQESQAIEYATNVLTQFASMPGHEHFNDVREIMGNLMATGVCGDLETAYQQAVVLHPNLRQKLIDAEIARRTAAQAQDTARRNAASITGSTPGSVGVTVPPTGGKPGSIRASVEEAFERATRG